MLPLIAMVAVPALATPRLHSAHVRDNGDGTSSLVITADGPDAVDISTATARIATGEALTLLPERTFVEGTVVVPVSR